MIPVELEPIPNPAPATQSFKVRFRPNTPIYSLIGLVILAAVIGTIFSPSWTVNILGFCLFVATSLFGIAKQNDAAERAAERDERAAARDSIQAAKVEKVAVNLEERSDKTENHLKVIEKTGEKTHKLVNSNMGAQLKIAYIALQRVADLTKHADDIKAAEIAKEALDKHEEQQAAIDRKEEKQDPKPAPEVPKP